MSSATGKLVESQVARRGRFDERLAHGADAAYWLSLWTQEELELAVAGEGDGADYTLASAAGSLARGGDRGVARR